jgi:uncharacterized membrane protein YidH (DUF202 family)
MDPNFEKQLGNIKKEGVTVKKEMRERTFGYIVTALGLVAGLAWNEAIKALIEMLFPVGAQNTVLAKVVYAVSITIVVVVGTMYLTRLFQKDEP